MCHLCNDPNCLFDVEKAQLSCDDWNSNPKYNKNFCSIEGLHDCYAWSGADKPLTEDAKEVLNENQS